MVDANAPAHDRPVVATVVDAPMVDSIAPLSGSFGAAREAVETLWSCYGAQGLYTRDPLQRHLRDVLAMAQHFSFNFDIAGSAYGLHALGGAYANPTL